MSEHLMPGGAADPGAIDPLMPHYDTRRMSPSRTGTRSRALLLPMLSEPAQIVPSADVPMIDAT